MQDKTQYSIEQIMGILISQYPILVVATIVIIGTVAGIFAFMFFHDLLSKKARMVAETNETMTRALKNSTDSLATAPQIVSTFSSLVETLIKREVSTLDGKIEQSIVVQLDKKYPEIKASEDKIVEFLKEIQDARDKIRSQESDFKKKSKEVMTYLEEIKKVLPDYENWKEVADPAELTQRLNSIATWKEGKDIVGNLQRLVEGSEDKQEQVPAKYIEIAGDWCRNRNQLALALWFYERAIKRDPDLVGAKIEYLSLVAEYVPSRRTEALSELESLTDQVRLNLNQLRRIFNALIEIDQYEKLKQLCTRLLSNPFYAATVSFRAAFFRDRAVASKAINNNEKTAESWLDINEAMNLKSTDENILKIIVTWHLEDENAELAIENAKRLLMLDPFDMKYHLFLAEAYAIQGNSAKCNQALETGKLQIQSPIDELTFEARSRQITKTLIRNNQDFYDSL